MKKTHTEILDCNKGVIHVLYKTYLSTGQSEVLGYFKNTIYASLAWKYEIYNYKGIRQIVFEIKPEYDIIDIIPFKGFSAD